MGIKNDKKQEKLAKALRDNLLKRKQQARSRVKDEENTLTPDNTKKKDD